MLLTSRHMPENTSPGAHHNAYLVCTEVTLPSEETVRPGDWVLTHSSPESTLPVVAQVSEIWQRVGSANHQQGCVDGILIQRHMVGGIHETYQMPRLHPEGWSLISVEVCTRCHVDDL